MEDGKLVEFLQANIKNSLAACGSTPLFNVVGKYKPSVFFAKLMVEAGLKPWNCSCCDTFLNRYGRIAIIDQDTGKIIPVLWNIVSTDLPEHVETIIRKMNDLIATGKVVSSYVSPESNPATLGFATKGGFNHLHVNNSEGSLRNTIQMKKAVDVNVARIGTMIRDWGNRIPVMEELQKHLANANSNRKVNFAKSLMGHIDNLKAITAAKGNERNTLIYQCASEFGLDGRAGVKGTVVGETLDKFVETGDIEKAFKIIETYAGATTYQRPTTSMADISELEFNKSVAEIEKLGYKDSIARRVVKLEEVADLAIWTTTPTEEKDEGDIFSKARGTDKEPSITELTDIKQVTVDTFMNKVLPQAKRLFMALNTPSRGVNIGCVFGSANQDAPSPLKWDTPETPNQYSWGMNPKLTPATQLMSGQTELEINSLHKLPCEWYGSSWKGMSGLTFHSDEFSKRLEQYGEKTINNCMFPEIAKGVLFPHRKVIEAVNRETMIEVTEQNMFYTGMAENVDAFPILIVDNGDTRTRYQLFVEQI